MFKENSNRTLRRNVLTLALGFTLASVAGVVFAQSSAGSLFGNTQAGAIVTIKNLDTGTSREITADSAGRFSATQLPTGRYRVTTGGSSKEIQVKVGTGTAVSFESTPSDSSHGATDLDRVQVTGAAINPIDVSSVESTTVFTQAQIQQLPIGRDISNVALLAPGTVQGDTGLGKGNLASFGGSSVAENGYFVNGFDVTNIRNFISFASLPFDAIGEQQIKTGGYGAEYGRSLGGVINLVTKRGTNEWKGGASFYWSPGSLREPGTDVLTNDSRAIADGRIYSAYRSANSRDDMNFNVYMGGPLVKDRLFVFALAEGNHVNRHTFQETKSEQAVDDSPAGIVKIDWNITDNHLLEFTGIQNKKREKFLSYRNANKYARDHELLTDSYTQKSGGDVFIGRYTGYLTDDLTLSAQAARLTHIDDWRTKPSPSSQCPAAYDSRTGGLKYIGCWNDNEFTVSDRSFGPDTDERKAYRLDAEWRFGDHFLRFGYDDETFVSRHPPSQYSGGIYYRYFSNTRVRVRTFQTLGGEYEVKNSAAYLEDNWHLNDNWLLYLGLRAESFDNKNPTGVSFVKASNLIAPRLGFSWDVNGDSTFKVFGNLGRYYIPVASNTNIRASGAEQLITEFYNYRGIDPVTGVPITLGSRISGPDINGRLTPPDARTVAVDDLKPMYQDELILGAQWALGDWVLGLKGVFREVRNGMDDYCSHSGFAQWAADNGHRNFRTGSMAPCFIINPGRDVKIALDLNNDGNYTVNTVPNSYLGLPEYQRKYQALELNWERPKQDGMFLQGSYTLARSVGNVEGYVNSSLEQEDAGLTQDFDNRFFEDGAYGPLPNDRRHTIKVFGTYDLNDQWSLSGNLVAQSGRPVNCLGYLPLERLPAGDASELSPYGASSFYCLRSSGLGLDGMRELRSRGTFGRTPWKMQFDLGLAYTPTWANDKLKFGVDIFNVFNRNSVTEYDEVGEKVRETERAIGDELPGSACNNDRDATDGERCYQVNSDFLHPENFQSPRSVRFTVRYTW